MISKLIDHLRGLFRPGVEISYTRINAYRTCPWKYKLMFEDGLRIPPTPFISLGLSVHRALEDFHLRQGKALDDLIESYDRCWVNEGFVTPQQAHDFYEKGNAMLAAFFRDAAGSTTEIVAVEKEFSLKLGRHRLKGIIDRIDRHSDGTYEVIDYKTHAELWKQERVDTDLQLGIYTLACEKALGITPGSAACYFLAHGKKLSTRRSRAQLKETAVLIADIADKIGRRQYPRNPAHCPRCDFRRSCGHATAQARNGKK